MSIYIYEHKKWPEFHWDHEQIAFRLAEVRYRQGRLLGRMEGLPGDLQTEANLHTLTLDVLASSEIGGVLLDPIRVRSSIAHRLGMNVTDQADAGRYMEGIIGMMLDATQHFNAPMTRERLFGWHAALFSSPTQVASSFTMGKEKIHFQAPHSHALVTEIRRYLDWFNSGNGQDPVIKAAIAHLWFITIHPFAHGNGRIARALTDMQLSGSGGDARRFYSMSARIKAEGQGYGDRIERAKKEKLDITSWIKWFLDCLDRSIADSDGTLAVVRQKARFWEKYPAVSFNDRQRMMLNKLLDGFTGKLTSSQWARLTETSQDSAGRDIADLVERGILAKQPGGGRSTSYLLVS